MLTAFRIFLYIEISFQNPHKGSDNPRHQSLTFENLMNTKDTFHRKHINANGTHEIRGPQVKNSSSTEWEQKP